MSIKAHYGGLKNVFSVGSFTRDTAVASGAQAITGIGFEPIAVIFIACQQNAAGEMSTGVDDGSGQKCVADEHGITADTYGIEASFSISDIESGANQYQGKVNSFDADGFTIGWTKTGLPTGTFTIQYFAIGGEDTVLTESSYGERNRFKVGSFTRDTTVVSGNQAVAGIGFEPRGVLFFACEHNAAGEASWGFDDGSGLGCIYDRHNVGANTHAEEHTILSILDLHAAGADYYGKIGSVDSDGFTIAWTKTGASVGTFTVNYLAFR